MADRTERILTLLGTLSDGSFPSVDKISRKYGVSRRTFFRDIKEMRKAGLVVRFDRPNQGYSLVSQHATPTNPSPDDLAELIRLASTSALPQSRSQRRGSLRATEALARNLPEETQEEIKWLDAVVQSEITEPSTTREVIDQVISASYAQQLIDIDFGSDAPDLPEPFRILPQRLRHHSGKWMLEGIFVADHRSLIASLDRIAGVQVLQRPKPPSFSRNVLVWSEADIEII